MRRYPMAPLAALAGLQVHELARELNLGGTTWKEYRDWGMSEKVADRMACKLGFDPYVVWPEMLDAAIADIEVECPECGERFVPPTKRRVYCGKTCANRADNRNRQADPVRHQADLERQRQRYSETRDYELAQRRRHYWANWETVRARQNEQRRARRGERLKETG